MAEYRCNACNGACRRGRARVGGLALVAGLATALLLMPGGAAKAQDDLYGAGPGRSTATSARSSGGGGQRLALQLRNRFLNWLLQGDRDRVSPSPLLHSGGGVLSGGWNLAVGLWLQPQLFVGLGLGLGTITDGGDGFALVPTVLYDLLENEDAALYLHVLGVFGRGDGTVGPGVNQLGLSAGLGVRYLIAKALALGAELGWGFQLYTRDPGDDVFMTAVYGGLMLEFSIGLSG